ncbi:MAG TPA: cell division protein ZapA, partial [Acetobacteraceae bacterium]|nr:cell division protein ZapA [Acetobacteraceae bacterium]
TLRINGYAYTVGCQDGEEAHLQAMADEVEKRIDTIKAGAGQSGEARMLVMASLLMADDLYELGKSLRAAQAGQPVAAPLGEPKLGRRLGKLAKRAEDIALDLERP